MLPRESQFCGRVRVLSLSLSHGTWRELFEHTICMEAGAAGKDMHPSMHDAMNYSILWRSMDLTIYVRYRVRRSAIEAKSR